MLTNDLLWKGIIESMIEDFLTFFYPDDVHDFDFSKGFTFLDKELAELFPDLESESRYVDKLVRVYLKNGIDKWILIHIEVQGYYDPRFLERMFIYYYRIFERYGRDIGALAIFTDSMPTFKPDTYRREFLKTRLEYSFPICKVIEQEATTLEQSNNPFAMVILATLIELKKGSTDDEGIKNIKRRLTRLMFDKNFTKEKIRTLFAFINQYIRFAKIENTRIFASEIASTYQSHPNNMGLLEIIREHDLNEAKKQGLEQGFAKGVEAVILSAYQNGISPVLIAKIVKQPLDKVMAIIQGHFPTERKD